MASDQASRVTTLLAEVARYAGSDSGRTVARFLASLREHFPRLEIHLFETKGRRITPVEAGDNIEDLVSEPDINACLSDRKTIAIDKGKQTTQLFPVLVNNSVTMVAITKRSKRLQVDIDEFRALVTAYGNILSLVQVSERDTLTGLFNRRMLDRRLPEMMIGLRSPRRRTVDPVSAHIALVDLDRFKKINDTYGHLYGDEVLLLFSGLMKQSFRSSDVLVRYGGEEFVVVLTDTTPPNAEKVMERFRAKVEDYWFPRVGHVTISVGLVPIGAQALPTTVLDQADRALYYAKRNGRNQVCSYTQLVKQKLIAAHEPATGEISVFEEKRKSGKSGRRAVSGRRAKD